MGRRDHQRLDPCRGQGVANQQAIALTNQPRRMTDRGFLVKNHQQPAHPTPPAPCSVIANCRKSWRIITGIPGIYPALSAGQVNSVSLTEMRENPVSTNHRDSRLLNARCSRHLTWLRFKPDQNLHYKTFVVGKSHYPKSAVTADAIRTNFYEPQVKRTNSVVFELRRRNSSAQTCPVESTAQGHNGCDPQPALQASSSRHWRKSPTPNGGQIGSDPYPPLAAWRG